jgi:branched-chain amino acid transport system substrate-binding protein
MFASRHLLLMFKLCLAIVISVAFVRAYRAMFHEDTTWFSDCGYTCMMWIHKAVEAIDGKVENKDRFLSALKKVEMDAPRGPIKLDSFGNPIENVYITSVKKVGETYQSKIIYTYPKVSQFWHWNQSEYLKQPSYSKDWPPCKFCSAAN